MSDLAGIQAPHSAEDTRGGAAKEALLPGLGAGAATFLGSGLVLLLLGFIPSQASHGLFGVRYARPLSGWVSGAFLGPFWGSNASHPVGEQIVTVRSLGMTFGALLVFAAVLWLVGRVACRHVPPGLRQRGAVLLVTALVVAAGAAVTAIALSHGSAMSYGALSNSTGAFVATLLLGAFCFGVVGLLPQPWSAALRRAGILVGACFLAGGLLFPTFVVSDGLPNANVGQDFAAACPFSSAVGGLVLPLALQAPVSLTQTYGTPWQSRQAAWPHWYRLAQSTILHPHERLFQHASSLGVNGSLVGAALTAAVLCALVLISWGLCRKAGARGARHGLHVGLVEGTSVAALLVPVLWLSSNFIEIGTGEYSSALSTYWGITAIGLAQSLATIVVVCSLTGWLYGARQARRAGASGDAHALQIAPPQRLP